MTTENPNSLPIQPQMPPQFVERRDTSRQRQSTGMERRQFTNSFSELSDDAAELGRAIDQYKLLHRRRYIDYEEMLMVIKSIGYKKS